MARTRIRSRRQFLAACSTLASGVILARAARAGDERPRSAGNASSGAGQRYLIVNADDFGMTSSVSRGVLVAQVHGVVTSTSLMVTARAAEEAVDEARGCPEMSIGLHADFTSGPAADIPMADLPAVAAELDRQIDRFFRLVGAPPTHLDSHHHVHTRFNWARIFLDAGARLGVPIRGFSPVVYVGGFYGRWPGEPSNPRHISYEALVALARGLGPGVSEIGCHPGYFGPGVDVGYGRERDIEVRALTDPRLRRTLEGDAIRLVSYRDLPRLGVSPARR